MSQFLQPKLMEENPLTEVFPRETGCIQFFCNADPETQI